MLHFLRPLAPALSFVALIASATLVARAQSSWTAVSAPTPHTLWGVCFGGGQFVAVGDNGTILTSPDGLAWTPRASGTTAWLTSVDYGLGSFLAVGDSGTVLRSRDAITWENLAVRSARPPPPIRFNVVRFSPAGFLIYGEQHSALRFQFPSSFYPFNDPRPAGPWWRSVAVGLDHTVVGGETGIAILPSSTGFSPLGHGSTLNTEARHISGLVFVRDTFTAVGAAGAILTSTDATHWSRQDSGTTENLHGLAAFNNTLIAVGERGTILTQDSLGLWQRRAAPTSDLLLAVAASDTAAVIVGANGTILRATPTPLPPTILTAPAAVTETLGGAASFLVRASGSLPLTYQWQRNSVALPGETRDTLSRTPLTPADAGSYTVAITNSAGAVTSPVAALNLLPAPAAIVDESFRADPQLDGTVTALLPLADGGVLVATHGRFRDDPVACRVRKLRPDGALDPTWQSNVFSSSDPRFFASITTLRPQPDGKILVAGTFSHRNDELRPNLLRLNPDGTLDPLFTPRGEPIARPVTDVDLQSDGRILVANNGTVPLRLLPSTGELDPSFQPAPLPGAEIPGRPGMLRDRLIRRLSVSREKIYVGGIANLQITNVQGFVPDTLLVRLTSDGAVDPAFPAQQWGGDMLGLRVLQDESVLVLRGFRFPGVGFPTKPEIIRLRPDGSNFPGYLAPAIPSVGPNHIYPDGRFLYFDFAASGPARLTASGFADPTFTGGVGTPAVLVAADDHVFAGGGFTVYNGKPANRVVRLHAAPNQTLHPPRLLALSADRLTLRVGETARVHAAVSGSAELTYDWTPETSATFRTASPIFAFSPRAYGSGAATLRLTVRNPRGESASAALTFTILPDPPVITEQPSRVATQTGRNVTLRIERNSDAGPTEVEWRRDHQLLPRPREPWEDGQTLRLQNVTAADAGAYTVTFRNLLGASVTSPPIIITVDASSRFANLSTRAHVDLGNPIIAGFTLGGSGYRQVLLRGIGRGLERFGVNNALPDPQIFVYQGSTVLNAGNLDWDNTSPDYINTLRTTFERFGVFPLETGSKDAAALTSLTSGSYTVHLTDQSGASGAALVEIYEADHEAAPILNLSTRATVTPSVPTIAGFAIVGPVPKRVLLRAVGPALASFSVTNPLADPRLELRDATGRLLAANDDWPTASDLAALSAATQSAGAFPLAAGSRDAALLLTLAPGNYTALATGANALPGVVLLEIYEVPDSP